MTALLVTLAVYALLALGGIILMFRRFSLLGGLIATPLVLIVAFIGAVLTVPHVVTLNDFKPQIITKAKEATGRDLTIEGPITFSLWPVLGLGLSDVTFSNVAGAKDPVMASVKSATVGVELLALRRKEINVTEFRLIEPNILLTTDANKIGNWEFMPAKRNAASQAAPDDAAGEKSPAAAPAAPPAFTLSNFVIEKGHFIYRPFNGQAIELNDVNTKLDMSDMYKTGTLSGDMVWNGRNVKLKGRVDTPNSFMTTQSGKIDVSLSAGSDHAALVGEVKSLTFVGEVSSNVDDLAGLISWATAKPASALPVKALDVSGKVSASILGSKIEALKIKADDLTITGTASAIWVGDGKPSFSADLNTGVVNLDNFMPPAAPVAASESKPAAPEKAPDLSALNTANANITANIEGIIVKGVTMGSTTAKLRLKNGRADASITPTALYGGTVKADMGVDARGFMADVVLSGVGMEPVLTQFAGFNRLSGKGDATVSLRGPVSTTENIKRGLMGNGQIVFRDGAFKGVNLAALVRSAKGMLTGQQAEGVGETQQTDFTELAGTFTIANGIVTNNDLKMLSPLLRVNGKGTVSIPASTVNYRVEANLVADISGQGGADKTGIMVPIMITGPFSKLSYAPDLKSLIMGNLDSGGQIIDAAKNIKKDDLKNLGKDGLKNLLGGSKAQPAPADGTTAPAPQKTAPADQLLNGLFGKKP